MPRSWAFPVIRDPDPMDVSTILRRPALLAGAAVLLAAPLRAQAVAGELVDRAGGKPVPGALVVLLDEQGVQRARAMTTAAGAFLVRAPAAGRYRLRAERVGFASTTSPLLDLAVDQTVRYRLEAAEEVVRLEAVAAQGRRRACRVRPGQGEATAALWEEARKALSAAAHVESQGLLSYDISVYERELDPATLQVISEKRRTGSSRARSAFVSVPAEELARHGFIRVEGGNMAFYVPDAQVLLSDVFLDGHCFRIADQDPPQPGLVGLAFEPAGSGRRPDVAGVLWLDGRTAALRLLEYRYTRAPAEVADPDRLGGRVEFDRAPSGEWFVRRWRLRMPTVAPSVTHHRLNPNEHSYQRSEGSSLVALREEGGEVVSTSLQGARAVAIRGRVEGTVWDSVGGRPLRGATVFLSGTQYAARTDSAGAFRIDEVPEGSYSASYTHPDLAALSITPAARPVSVRAGAVDSVRFATPPLGAVLASVCPDTIRTGEWSGVVLGRVTDEGGQPVAGAPVEFRWSRLSTNRRGAVNDRLATRTDAEGFYRACGLPTELALTSSVATDAGQQRLTLRMMGQPALRQDFRLMRSGVARADSEGQAIALAPVEATARAANDGFARRRGRGGGHFYGRDDIERRRPRNLADLLRNVPGAVLVPADGGFDVSFAGRMVGRETLALAGTPSGSDLEEAARAGGAEPGRRYQPRQCTPSAQRTGREEDQRGECVAGENGGPSPTRTTCPVLYFLDGQPLTMPPGSSLSNEIPISDVDGVEVYPRVNEVPAEYRRAGAECGVVLIWTRRSRSG